MRDAIARAMVVESHSAFVHEASRAAVALADVALSNADAYAAWDWGEGLLLSALVKHEQRHVDFVAEYFSAHRRGGWPRIDASDACAPGLAALELLMRRPCKAYREVCARITEYLQQAPRTSGQGLNHLGTRWYARLYPRSMWVDSLVMYVVFAARWAQQTGRVAWREFAVDQVLAFARVAANDRYLRSHHALSNPRIFAHSPAHQPTIRVGRTLVGDRRAAM